MKNAGMAGAVALVGIGLLSIGIGRESRHAGASTPFTTPLSSTQMETKLQAGDCPTIEILEPVLRPFGQGCNTPWYWTEATYSTADVLNTGTPQAYKMPQVTNDPNGENPPPDCVQNGYLISGQGPVRFAIDWFSLDYEAIGFGGWLGQSGQRLSGIAWVDVDDDGRLDLILKGPRLGTSGPIFAWLRNIYDGPSRLPADLNHDGRVDGEDLGTLFSQWTG